MYKMKHKQMELIADQVLSENMNKLDNSNRYFKK